MNKLKYTFLIIGMIVLGLAITFLGVSTISVIVGTFI